MIEQEQAVRIARDRARVLGWAFADPLAVVERRGWLGKVGRFAIETNACKRGTKVRFVIDAETGEVVSEGHLTR